MDTIDVLAFHPHLKKPLVATVNGQKVLKSLCPYHEESTASFCVFESGGFKCYGCGQTGHANQLCDKLGIAHVVGKSEEPRRLGANQWLETTYEYRHPDGRKHGVVELYRCADGSKKPLPKTLVNGELVFGRKKPFPLYHADEVVKDKLSVLWWVEGEKCADCLRDKGLLATTNQGGSKSFEQADKDSLDILNGRTVVILPDNDDPGEVLAEQVFNECRRRGASASILRLPGLEKEGDDVYDWFKLGHTVDELKELADGKVTASRQATAFVRHLRGVADSVEAGGDLSENRRELLSSVASVESSRPSSSMSAADAFARAAERRRNAHKDPGWDWGIDALDAIAKKIKRRKLIAVAGDSGSGKSALVLQAADNVANSGGAVKIYSQEMEAEENVERIAARLLGKKVDDITAEEFDLFADVYRSIPFDINEDRVDLDFLVADIRLWAATSENPALVIVDFVQLMKRNLRQPEHEMVHEVAYTMKGLAKELGIAIILLGQLDLATRRGHQKLTKASVRGGGSLADASDQFILIEAEEPDQYGITFVKFILDKFRAGAKAEARALFDGPHYEFRDRNAQKLVDVRDKACYYDEAADVEYFSPVVDF